MKIYVSTKSILEYSYREDKEYGDWKEYWNFVVLGVCANEVRNGYYQEFNIPDLPQKPKSVYLVILTYGDGDSFGNAYGKGEVVWCFIDLDLAHQLCNDIRSNKFNDNYHITFTIENGQEIKVQNPAYDYFTHIDSARVEEFAIEY